MDSMTARHLAPGPYCIEVAKTAEDVERFRDFWEHWAVHFDADPDYYLTVIKAYPHMVRPHVVLLTRDGQPRTLAVGRIEETDLTCNLGYKTVCRPAVRSLTMVYDGLLGDTSEEACAAVFEAWHRSLSAGEAEVVFLNPVRTDSTLYKTARSAASTLTRDHASVARTHWRLPLPDSFEEYLKSHSAKTRSNLKYMINRLKRTFGDRISITSYGRPDDMDRMMASLEAIASKTYHRGLGVGFADTPEMRARCALLLEKHYLRSHVMFLDGEPVAFWSGILYKGTYFADYTGYSPAIGQYYPGKFLLMHIVRELCEEKAATAIDFGPGDSRYKQIFASECWQESPLYVFGCTAKAISLNLGRTLLLSVNHIARGTLERLNAVDFVRKRWRALLARRPSDL